MTSATKTPDADQDAVGIVEKFGGYGEDETDDQLVADREEIQGSQGPVKAKRTTVQV